MRLFIQRVACVAAILGSPLIASSQHYYVVVGAFAADEKASELKGYLPELLTDTSYAVSEGEGRLPFYVVETSDKDAAISRSIQLKQTMDAWNQYAAPLNLPADNAGTSKATPADELAASGASAAPASSAVDVNAPPPPPVGKYFKFKIESPEGMPVMGKVHHVDFETGRELGAYQVDTFVDMLRPGQAKPMSVVCGLFGYKEVHKVIDYSDPSVTDANAYVDSQGAWVIPYKLERVEKGDVSTMYNVSFYKDASVMRPSSRADLDELVRMMRTNPYYEITIHAHCNGKNKREIISIGEDKNYFDVKGSVVMDGTSKDLTTLRAEAIRSYLMDHGIDAHRTRIFSWGGSDMLVKADSPEASLNDRIEIEFTRD